MTESNIVGDFGSYEAMIESFDYSDIFDEMDWDAPDRLNIAHETVDRHADDDAVAITHVDESLDRTEITFRELSAESSRLANVLRDLGLEIGDRVFTYLPRIPEHYVVLIGILKAGAVFGAINERYGPDGIEHRLRDSGASVVVTTSEHASQHGALFRETPSVDHLLVIGDEPDVAKADSHYGTAVQAADPEFETATINGEDNALLYYTSGTTGPSKGVVHSQQWLPAPATTVKYVLDLKTDDLYWSTGDMGWLTGPLHALGAWFWGHEIFVYQGEFDIETWLQLLDEYPISILLTVPTAYRSFVEHDELFDEHDVDIRHAGSIGEPLGSATIEWAKDRLGTTIRDTYGLTESGADLIGNLPNMDVKPGSMGKPIPGVDIAVVDSKTGEPLSTNDTGEIAWKGEVFCFFKEYWGDVADKADSYVGEWFLTGDLAYEDKDGYFWFEGRADDVILSSGYRIGSFELEDALTNHPAVAEAAVVPKPHDRRGNIVKAYIRLTPDRESSEAIKDDIKSRVRENLAKHEYPREIEFVDELPKTVTGKIRRTELQDRVQSE